MIDLVTVKLVREKSIPYQCNSPEKTYELLQKLIGDKPQEHFITLCIDAKGVVNNASIIHIGAINKSVISPRAIFRTAILSNAVAIIIGHNHPSGNPTPSPEDKLTTKELIKAGTILDIKILDHIIIGNNIYYSFRERGQM
jgi:DNA repair protein RadC